MNDRTWIVVAVLLSVAAATGTSLLLQPTAAVSAPSPARDPRLDDIARRLLAVESRTAASQSAPSAIAEPSPLRTAADHLPADRIAELASRLQAVEARLARLDGAAPHRDPRGLVSEANAPETAAQPPLTKVDAQQLVLNVRATAEDRVRAQEALRRVSDAYTPAMVQELLHLAMTHPDGQLRAAIWRNFDGATVVEGITPALLDAVARDAEPSAREEAAETLGNYLADPAVKAALQVAADHDAEEKVRNKAKRTLEGIQPSKQQFGPMSRFR